MKPPLLRPLGVIFAIGLLSGCSSSDTAPIIMPPSGPTAAVEDQRTSQSDALASDEAALVSQADSEPIPAPKPDL